MYMGRKKYFILLLMVFSLSACSLRPRTISYDLASLTHDHTIGIASNPFSATGKLLLRIKTFTAETLNRIHLKLFGFPFLKSKIPPILTHRSSFNKDAFDKWLDLKTGKPVKGDIKIFISGNEFFPVLEKEVVQAKKYINLSTYIFDNDQYGIYFADLLKKQSKSIKVKVISDMLGCAVAWDNSDDINDNSYIQNQNMFTYLTENSRVRLKKSRNIWLGSDHIKMIAIDGKKVFFGGMNIGNEYRYDWRDLMFELKGDITSEFQRIFDNAWLQYSVFGDFLLFFKKKFQRKLSGHNSGSIDFHILRTSSFIHNIYKAQLEAARRAKHHIYIENPYIWNEAFIYELCAARNRGVDVRVTIPGDFDVKTLSGINKRIANILLKYGIRVFVYPGTSHIKAASFDGWVCFGTANYDDLSLHKNDEINLATSNPVFSEKFENKILLKGQAISSEITESFQIQISDMIRYELKDYL